MQKFRFELSGCERRQQAEWRTALFRRQSDQKSFQFNIKTCGINDKDLKPFRFDAQLEEKNRYLALFDEVCVRKNTSVDWQQKLETVFSTPIDSNEKERIVNILNGQINTLGLTKKELEQVQSSVSRLTDRQILMLANPMSLFQRTEAITDIFALPQEQFLKLMVEGFQFQGLEAIFYRDLLRCLQCETKTNTFKFVLQLLRAIGLLLNLEIKEQIVLFFIFVLAGTYAALGNFFTSSSTHTAQSHSRLPDTGVRIHTCFPQLPQMHPAVLGQMYYLFGVDSHLKEGDSFVSAVGQGVNAAAINLLYRQLLQAISPGQTNYLQSLSASVSPQLLIFDHSMNCFFSKSRQSHLPLKYPLMNKVYAPAFEHSVIVARTLEDQNPTLNIFWGAKETNISLLSANKLIRIQPLSGSNFVAIGEIVYTMIEKMINMIDYLNISNNPTLLEMSGSGSENSERAAIIFLLLALRDCFISGAADKSRDFAKKAFNNVSSDFIKLLKGEKPKKNCFKSTNIYITVLQPEFFVDTAAEDQSQLAIKTRYIERQLQNAQTQAAFAFARYPEKKIVLVATVLDKKDMVSSLMHGEAIGVKIADHLVSIHIRKRDYSDAIQIFDLDSETSAFKRYSAEYFGFQSYFAHVEFGSHDQTEKEDKGLMLDKDNKQIIASVIGICVKANQLQVDIVKSGPEALQRWEDSKAKQKRTYIQTCDIVFPDGLEVSVALELLKEIYIVIYMSKNNENKIYQTKFNFRKNEIGWTGTSTNTESRNNAIKVTCEVIVKTNGYSLKLWIEGIPEDTNLKIAIDKPESNGTELLEQAYSYYFPVDQMVFKLSNQDSQDHTYLAKVFDVMTLDATLKMLLGVEKMNTNLLLQNQTKVVDFFVFLVNQGEFNRLDELLSQILLTFKADQKVKFMKQFSCKLATQVTKLNFDKQWDHVKNVGQYFLKHKLFYQAAEQIKTPEVIQALAQAVVQNSFEQTLDQMCKESYLWGGSLGDLEIAFLKLHISDHEYYELGQLDFMLKRFIKLKSNDFAKQTIIQIKASFINPFDANALEALGKLFCTDLPNDTLKPLLEQFVGLFDGQEDIVTKMTSFFTNIRFDCGIRILQAQFQLAPENGTIRNKLLANTCEVVWNKYKKEKSVAIFMNLVGTNPAIAAVVLDLFMTLFKNDKDKMVEFLTACRGQDQAKFKELLELREQMWEKADCWKRVLLLLNQQK